MRAALAHLGSFSVTLLVASVTVACAGSVVAPRDDVTPPSDTENVSVVISGDVILNGRLFGGENDPAVILTHMRLNDQTAWFDYAQELADHGYAALTFDFRGYGLSTGDQDYDKLDEDLTAVIEYLRDRGKDDVYLVGASMGATTSLVVAGPASVNAVVAISPPAEFESQSAITAVPTLEAPKLFLVSEEDAPTLQFDALFEAAAEPKEEELYPGNLHGTDLMDPTKNEGAAVVANRIIDFLDDQR